MRGTSGSGEGGGNGEGSGGGAITPPPSPVAAVAAAMAAPPPQPVRKAPPPHPAAVEYEVGLGAKLMSSSAGALLVALATTPLDVVKTRLQAVVAPALAARQALGLTAAAKSCVYYPICKNADAAYLRAACAHSALHTLPPPPAPSTLATMSNVVRAEGVGSLWSGMTTTLAMAVPSNMLYFTAYDELKGVLTAAAPVGSLAATFTPLVAGVAGRVVTASAMSPLELVRTKAMAAGSRINVVTLLRREVAAHGVASLWRGLSPTLWRDVPFSGVYWMGYERLKAALLARARSGADNASAPVSTATMFSIALASGSLSGAVAATITTPFDVIKTRRQVQAYRSAQCGTAVPCSTLDTVRFIAREEGAGGLFAGVGPRVAKVAPACAIMIASYELGKRWLGRPTAASAAASDHADTAFLQSAEE